MEPCSSLRYRAMQGDRGPFVNQFDNIFHVLFASSQLLGQGLDHKIHGQISLVKSFFSVTENKEKVQHEVADSRKRNIKPFEWPLKGVY